jgi:hypothetical protein
MEESYGFCLLTRFRQWRSAACPGLPTELSSSRPAALQFAHGDHHDKPEVPLHAMRDDGRPL